MAAEEIRLFEGELDTHQLRSLDVVDVAARRFRVIQILARRPRRNNVRQILREEREVSQSARCCMQLRDTPPRARSGSFEKPRGNSPCRMPSSRRAMLVNINMLGSQPLSL